MQLLLRWSGHCSKAGMDHCRSTAERRNKKEALAALGHQSLQVILFPLEWGSSAWEVSLSFLQRYMLSLEAAWWKTFLIKPFLGGSLKSCQWLSLNLQVWHNWHLLRCPLSPYSPCGSSSCHRAGCLVLAGQQCACYLKRPFLFLLPAAVVSIMHSALQETCFHKAKGIFLTLKKKKCDRLWYLYVMAIC